MGFSEYKTCQICGDYNYVYRFDIKNKEMSICNSCEQMFQSPSLYKRKNSNIFNHVKFNHNNKITISKTARLQLLKYIKEIEYTYTKHIKQKISNMDESKIMSFIIEQTKRNSWNKISGLNIWAINHYIWKLESKRGLSVGDFKCVIVMINWFEEDFKIQVWSEEDFTI